MGPQYRVILPPGMDIQPRGCKWTFKMWGNRLSLPGKQGCDVLIKNLLRSVCITPTVLKLLVLTAVIDYVDAAGLSADLPTEVGNADISPFPWWSRGWALGMVLQAIALAMLVQEDSSLTFQARVNGVVALLAMLAVGTITIMAYSPPIIWPGLVLFLPIIRVDAMAKLLAHLAHILTWSWKLSPTNVLYETDVWPLQAAALIWNDFHDLKELQASEDEHGLLANLAFLECVRWRPLLGDNILVQSVKLPFWFAFNILWLITRSIEMVIETIWVLILQGRRRNRVPVTGLGLPRRVVGHTAIITTAQLDWLQRYTMVDRDLVSGRLARRILVRALHVANLVSLPAFLRLHEHSVSDMGMNDYYKACEHELVKKAIGSDVILHLGLLGHLPDGNTMEPGRAATKQLLWARMVAGSFQSMDQSTNWRPALVNAVLHVAHRNLVIRDLGEATPARRHIYTVVRRWLVDVIMALWWDLTFGTEASTDPEAVEALLREKLLAGQEGNTSSLPQVVGEFMVATAREDCDRAICEHLLGEDWELWVNNTECSEGLSVMDCMRTSGEWHEYAGGLRPDYSVSSRFYMRERIGRILNRGGTSLTEPVEGIPAIGDKARAFILRRVVVTLVGRILEQRQAVAEQTL